jgi:hypothetical protein
MERGTLIQHLEVIIICEESFIDVDDNMVILNVYPMMKGEKKKVEKQQANTNKTREKECQYCKKSNHQEYKSFWNPDNLENKLKEKQEVAINKMVA